MTILKFIGLLFLFYGFGALLAIKAPGGDTHFLFWNDDDHSTAP